MLYQELSSRNQFLEKQIEKLKFQLSQYPSGHLTCIQNGKYVKNLYTQNGVRTHISKKNLDFIKTLAEKKYLSACLDDLIHEQDAISSFLKHYQNYTPKTQRLMKNPAYQKTISESIKPFSIELSEWAKETYERNSNRPEYLRHSCISGHIVRSKSEALIDQALFTHRIPFRYECALKLGELTLYPDFTIRHPETGNFFYWEHFGMMDSVSYSQNVFQKLQIYNSHGYIPTLNLITTYETQERPLTPETIETVIQQYFL